MESPRARDCFASLAMTASISRERLTAMKPKSIAIVGAAETTRLGVIPDTSQIQLHADAALNAMADAGLKPADIDGIATAGETPVTVAHYLGLTPKWVDGTAVGGCSFMIHVRHAAAAIASGLCETVLITHGESGRSGVGRTRNVVSPNSLAGRFQCPHPSLPRKQRRRGLGGRGEATIPSCPT